MEQQKWTRSTRCAADSPQCVEVMRVEGTTYVRDSKRNGAADQSVLAFDPDEWSAFVAGAKAGEFD